MSVPEVAASPSLDGTIDASWSNAAKITLDYDFTFRRPASDATTVYLEQDPSGLDIAVDAEQSEPITATQHTNNTGAASDDNLTIVLWPQGVAGFGYTFTANPNGARNQTSSENSAYAPQWTAVAKRTAHGYTLTMRIPFGIVRSGGSHVWKAQFERTIVASGALDLWTLDANQANAADPAFAGTLAGIDVSTTHAAARSQPRLQLYGLGELAPASIGGSTSRLGADLALPFTPTSSFLATVHPDYSNVEVDQQTIAPTEFARQFFEVRPFFTQAASNFNGHFGCTNCPTTLYTPAIPSFRDGYAVEGTQGRFSYGAFDALGYGGRSDDAEVASYGYSDPKSDWQFTEQRVGVNAPGLRDVTNTIATGYLDNRAHLGLWYNGGVDNGSAVTDPSLGGYSDYALFYKNPFTTLIADKQHVGAQFLPADGFVLNPDIDGWTYFATTTKSFSSKAPVRSVVISLEHDRFKNHFGRLDQADDNLGVTVNTRNLLAISGSTGSSYLLVPGSGLLPFTQNTLSLGYKTATATPTNVAYQFGRFSKGELQAVLASTTIPVARRVNLTLEDDRTTYTPDDAAGGVFTNQWLERASLDFQFTRDASFDLGARRIIGISAPTGIAPPSTIPLDASNLTAAFHYLTARNEFYLVYGDPNSLATTPALFLKWILYLGAPKGT